MSNKSKELEIKNAPTITKVASELQALTGLTTFECKNNNKIINHKLSLEVLHGRFSLITEKKAIDVTQMSYDQVELEGEIVVDFLDIEKVYLMGCGVILINNEAHTFDGLDTIPLTKASKGE